MSNASCGTHLSGEPEGKAAHRPREEEINEERNNQIEQYITKVANDFIKEQNSK